MKNIYMLILVLSSNTYPAKRNLKAQKNTWVKELKNFTEIEYFFYFPGDKFLISNHDIYFNIGKTTKDIVDRDLLVYEWLLQNYEFEFVFRTNNSSYINPKYLLEKTSSFADGSNFIYSGKIMNTNDAEGKNLNFVSGSGVLFSKNTIEKLIENKKLIDKSLWDDVAIGKLLLSVGIKPQSGKRVDIKGNIFKFNDFSTDDYHYRCRIDNHYGYPRFLEKLVMNELHNKIISKQTNNLKLKVLKRIFEIFKIFYINNLSWKTYSFIKKTIKGALPTKIYNIVKNRTKKARKKFYLRNLKE